MAPPPPSLDAEYDAFVRTVPARRGSFAGLPWRWYDAGGSTMPGEGPSSAAATDPGDHAVVIFPGAVGGADIFFVVLQRLARSGRVVAIDLPSTADGDRALDGLAALLDGLGIRTATLLGASFSGLFVQAFAQRSPSRTRALILSHTAAPDSSRAVRERRSAAVARRIPIRVMRGLLKLLVKMLLRRAPHRRLWTRLYFDALDALSRDDLIARYLLAASLEEAASVRAAPAETAAWNGPVLIIHSDNDLVAKPGEQARLRARYPDATWRLFPGTGHSTYAMMPVEYADAIASFVRSNRGQTHV